MESTLAPATPTLARTTAAPRDRTQTRRHDLYANIHKALRLAMADTLAQVGRLDSDDDGDVQAAAAAVRDLVGLCRSHLDKEEKFIHPALEAAVPGGAGRTEREHDDHLRAFDRLEAGVRAVERSSGARRAAAAGLLYKTLALFTADNFVHMHGEETDNNALLWSTFDDTELVTIERRIVASLVPEQASAVLRWMAPALNPGERAALFSGMRSRLPPAAFASLMSEALQTLDAGGRRKLEQALGR